MSRNFQLHFRGWHRPPGGQPSAELPAAASRSMRLPLWPHAVLSTTNPASTHSVLSTICPANMHAGLSKPAMFVMSIGFCGSNHLAILECDLIEGWWFCCYIIDSLPWSICWQLIFRQVSCLRILPLRVFR